jgi:hypothetical protein
MQDGGGGTRELKQQPPSPHPPRAPGLLKAGGKRWGVRRGLSVIDTVQLILYRSNPDISIKRVVVEALLVWTN